MGTVQSTTIKNKRTPTVEDPAINKWLVFAIIAFALLMNTIDATIVATALHTLQEELHTTVSWAGWTLTAYSFGFVLMLPLSAKLSMKYGHRKIFIISVATFSLASLLCGLSNNIHTLIFMRIIQAIGGAGITPSATGIIVEHFAHSRDRFLGLFGSIFSTGAMIGPIFGGIFVTYWSWKWIFFINIPVGLTVVLMALKFIPRSDPKNLVSEKMDFTGLIFMGIAIISAMYAATYLGEENTTILSPLFIGLAIASALAFYFLFRHLNKVDAPFVHPRFIIGKGFSAVNAVNIVHAGMVIGLISLVPLYAVRRYGLSELNSGTLLVAQGLASVVMSTVMSYYLRKTGYRMPIYIANIFLAAGLILVAVEPMFGLSPYLWLSISTFLIGFGGGFLSPAARNAGIQLAPKQAANIAAIRSMGIQFGQIVSIAVATSIIVSSLHPNFAQAMIYIGLAVFLVILTPIISRIPENKGAW